LHPAKCFFNFSSCINTNKLHKENNQDKFKDINMESKKYKLVAKNRMIMDGIIITIDESAKEDFKGLMGWNELDFKHNTILIKEE
jgi:hypothetical protein